MMGMNQTTHVMLRLLSDDAGLGAPVETRYDPKRRARESKASAALGACATSVTLVVAALIAYVR